MSATDNASITSTSTLTALGTPAATGPSNDYANLAIKSYKYTNFSANNASTGATTVTLNFGDMVAVEQSDGSIKVYEYMGGTPASVNLSNPTNAYTDEEYWKLVTPDQLAEEAQAQSANPASGSAQDGSSNSKPPGEQVTTSSSSTSLYALVDYNNVSSSTAAYITEANVQDSAGGVSVAASDTATITATDGSVVTTSPGGNGAGGVIATNHVLGSATADIDDATVAATDGDVAVTAQNTSSITATETTALTADGNAVSIEAAFNVIGWQTENIGELALDTLFGDPNFFGSATPDQTLAYISGDSTVTTTGSGNVTVSANGDASITATVGDQATSGNGDATANLNVGGVLATNEINTATNAYIGNAPASLGVTPVDASSVDAAGTVTVSATDAPTLTANSSITLSAQASTGGVASELAADYKYTDQSGQQTLNKGDQVYVQGGAIYEFQGTNGTSVDLTGNNSQFSSSSWTKVTPSTAPANTSNAESKAVGFIFVVNDAQGGATATVDVAGDITGGDGISVMSNEAASIQATTTSNLTSTGGGNGTQAGTGSQAAQSDAPDASQPTNDPGNTTTTPGGGLALGGAIVTNLVLAQSQASIQDATLSAGSGGINIDAEDNAVLNATTNVASSTGGAGSQSAYDLSIAFNSIGYAPSNFLFNAVDALIGGDYLASPQPDNATAYLSNAVVTADGGNLSVTAESNEQVNATVSNAATSTTSALYDASSTGFGGVLASNKVDGSAVAYIDNAGADSTTNIPVTGNLVVTATDNAGIYSNVKLVSSSIVTGTGAATPSSFTALGSNPSSFSNSQALNNGDTVTLDATYDTPTYTVGSSNPATTTLATGNVIADTSGNLYRYIGTGGSFDLQTDPGLATDTTNFVKIGGVSGDSYQYIGANQANVNLADVDYSATANWQQVPNTFQAFGANGAAGNNPVTLQFGDLVQINPGYADPDYTVTNGSTGPTSQSLSLGDVIQDGSTLYRYVGSSGGSLNLQNGNFTASGSQTSAAIGSDTTDFTVIGGTDGATYRYLGATNSAAASNVDLSNTNYDNLGYWQLVTPTDLVPGGLKTQAPGTTNYDALGSSPSNFSNPTTLNIGDTVTLDSSYDTPTYTVANDGSTGQSLSLGNVIQDGDTLYRYVGSGGSLNLQTGSYTASGSQTSASIASDTTDFKVIGGTDGTTYTFNGPSATTGTSLDLANADYTDTTLWTAQPNNGAENSGPASNELEQHCQAVKRDCSRGYPRPQ